LTNDYDYGINPCGEVAARFRTTCNLTEVNASICKDAEDFYNAVKAATIIGTLQASYTDFSYIDPRWSENCKTDALLGISITGQAEAQHILTAENLKEAARIAIATNEEWSKKIGINKAARIGCTKPSGTTSAFLGTTSGIHAAHNDFYLRRVRVEKSSPLAKHLINIFGLGMPETKSIIEQEYGNDDLIVVTIPMRNDKAINRNEENAIDLLNRVKAIYENWIVPSHRYGSNTHNVSVTVSYRPNEINDIANWMIYNKSSYSGISLLPYSGATYKQMPFEDITETEYCNWITKYPDNLYFEHIDFSGSEDTRKGENGCAGGSCELV